MPADTAEKRFSAMNISSPWRGCSVVPSVINQAERQAVMFMYSGILAGGGVGVDEYLFYYHYRRPRSLDAIAKKKVIRKKKRRS